MKLCLEPKKFELIFDGHSDRKKKIKFQSLENPFNILRLFHFNLDKKGKITKIFSFLLLKKVLYFSN